MLVSLDQKVIEIFYTNQIEPRKFHVSNSVECDGQRGRKNHHVNPAARGSRSHAEARACAPALSKGSLRQRQGRPFSAPPGNKAAAWPRPLWFWPTPVREISRRRCMASHCGR